MLIKNPGILTMFAVEFIIELLLFTEFNTSMANKMFIVRFKRGSQSGSPSPYNWCEDGESNHDYDKKVYLPQGEQQECLMTNSEKERTTLLDRIMDTFSWQHINYGMPTNQEDLMGESGAGKTILLNVLTWHVSTGMVTGDGFVNRQGLLADFRAQMLVFSFWFITTWNVSCF